MELTPDDRIRRARSAYITRALRSYVPRPYNGRITVIGAEAGRLGGHPHQFRDWQATAARVDTIMIPGDHSTIVTSEIDGLARAISEQMASAGDAGRQPTPSGHLVEREA